MASCLLKSNRLAVCVVAQTVLSGACIGDPGAAPSEQFGAATKADGREAEAFGCVGEICELDVDPLAIELGSIPSVHLPPLQFECRGTNCENYSVQSLQVRQPLTTDKETLPLLFWLRYGSGAPQKIALQYRLSGQEQWQPLVSDIEVWDRWVSINLANAQVKGWGGDAVDFLKNVDLSQEDYVEYRMLVQAPRQGQTDSVYVWVEAGELASPNGWQHPPDASRWP